MIVPTCYVFLISGLFLWMHFYPQRFLRQNQQEGKKANALWPIVKFSGTEEAAVRPFASPPHNNSNETTSHIQISVDWNG